MKIILRPGKQADCGFAIATWLRSYNWPGESADKVFHMDAALHRALAGSGKFVVACSSKDPDTLIGWALSEGGHPMWVYVGKDFRHKGVGKLLHGAVACIIPSSTSVGSQGE